MKARVKGTGEIVDVIAVGDYIKENGQIIGEYKDAHQILYTSNDLDFYIEEGITIPDYWTRLEHTYAGIVMQSILQTMPRVSDLDKYMKAAIDWSVEIAHALVEKIKNSGV